MAELDLNFIRAQFPQFEDGWAFFESAGGSYLPRQVIARVTEYMNTSFVQPAWDFEASARASGRIADAKARLAHLINAGADEILIGPSMTMNMYVLAQALRPLFGPGDEVIVTNLDHEANNGAWRRLADHGVTVREWQIDPETGALPAASLEALLNPRTRLVCFSHCSNVVGTINDVKALVARIHAAGALACVDGVAYAPHRLPDMQDLDVDFYGFSLYKTFGPHAALLYGKRHLLEAARPQNHYFLTDAPYTLNPGGPNHELTAGAAGIADYLDLIDAHHFATPAATPAATPRARAQRCYDLFAAHEDRLANRVLDYLGQRNDVRIIGERRADGSRAPTISFAIHGHDASTVAEVLRQARIAVGHGDFYAKRCVEALGLLPAGGVVRASLAHYTNDADVDRLIAALETVR
jgi:cysteine desulfurase family protein (TIGR01976 family)